jgi:hypothetical protein
MHTLRSICVLVMLAIPLFADGGAVLSRQDSGPFVITVFGAPVPLRAGPIDMTVMVQARDTLQPVLDADVSIRLDGASPIEAVASRSQAQNKLLYAATFDLPRPGDWKYTVSVQNAAGQAATSGELETGQPDPMQSAAWFNQGWFYLAIPPLLIAIFVLHQWLARRELQRC